MIEVLEFIFQSFWHWFGTLIFVTVIFGSIGEGLFGVVNLTRKRK